VEALDILPYYISLAVSLAIVVALLLYLYLRQKNEMEKLRQDMESKRQATDMATKALEKVLDELKEMRQSMESKLQATDVNVLDEVKAMRQDLNSGFERLSESEATPQATPTAVSGLDARLDRALADIDFLATYFKIQNGINEYASRIREISYEFISRVEDELRTLEQQEVEGREYVLRSNMLLFSLMMARIYLQVVGPRDSLPMIERYLARAKKLV